eukprot:4798563-Amphidinium_carterae.1
MFWKERLQRRDCVIAVDNVAAQQALVKLSTTSELMAGVAKCSALIDKKGEIRPWLTWVPSESNIADAPSRGNYKELDAHGAVKVSKTK